MSWKRVKKVTLQLLSIAVLCMPCALPARANLIINATFDSSITSDPSAASIEGAINTAIQEFETLYSNPVTVSIYFQEGGDLGTSNTLIYNVPYATADGTTGVYNQLVATDANPAAIAALNANGGDPYTNGGVNPVGGINDIEMKSANLRALGYTVAPSCVVTPQSTGNIPNECAVPCTPSSEPCTANSQLPHVDGIVSLQTSITDPPNSPQGSYFDLVATAEHEMDEILGLGSALENCVPTDTVGVTAACKADGALDAANDTPLGVGTPQDLFRWSAPTGGTRTLSTNCASPTSAYFAYGPDTGEIAQLNNACNDGDFGDWQSNPLPNGVNPQVQDAFSSAGQTPAYGQSEIDAMTAIGYTLATPEPDAVVLFGAGLAMLGVYRRRLGAGK
jgi:hypothetical protein